jgi:hypothetical protein
VAELTKQESGKAGVAATDWLISNFARLLRDPQCKEHQTGVIVGLMRALLAVIFRSARVQEYDDAVLDAVCGIRSLSPRAYRGLRNFIGPKYIPAPKTVKRHESAHARKLGVATGGLFLEDPVDIAGHVKQALPMGDIAFSLAADELGLTPYAAVRKSKEGEMVLVGMKDIISRTNRE